jgi:hypothetical protein
MLRLPLRQAQGTLSTNGAGLLRFSPIVLSVTATGGEVEGRARCTVLT